MSERFYNWPHLHHALVCLRGGHPENAVCWMWRTLGEVQEPQDKPDTGTLREGDGGIWYLTVGDSKRGLDGDGI